MEHGIATGNLDFFSAGLHTLARTESVVYDLLVISGEGQVPLRNPRKRLDVSSLLRRNQRLPWLKSKLCFELE